MTEPRQHALPDGLPTLRIRDLSIEFQRRRGAPLRMVDRVSIDIWPGEIVGVIGESGSGKTLTSLATLQMLPNRAAIAEGTIHLDDIPLQDRSERDMRALRGDRIALIPQDAMQSLNPTMRIGRQVGEPLELHSGLSSQRARQTVRKLLEAVHIREPEKRVQEYPHQFSGGMQQRAMIAMGLALNPQLLIADEPTTALDVTVQAQVLKLLREIRDDKGASIMFITHDLGIVAELCDWVYVMRNGQIVENGPTRRLFMAPQADYTRMLLDATLSIHTKPGVAQ